MSEWQSFDQRKICPRCGDYQTRVAKISRSGAIATYRLACRNCGYKWQMAEDEWEKAGQKECNRLANSPLPIPGGTDQPAGSYERIEWKPPDPTRGLLLVLRVILVFLMAVFSLFGALWFLTHQSDPVAQVIGSIAVILGLLAYALLMAVFKMKAVRIIPVAVIALIAIALYFLSR